MAVFRGRSGSFVLKLKKLCKTVEIKVDMFRNCFLFNTDSMLISFLMFLLLTIPSFKNNSLGLEGNPAPLTYIVLGLYSLDLDLLGKLGLQNVGKFSHFGVAVLIRGGVGVKKETAIGRFA